MTHEIQPENWAEFCQRFTKLHRGTQMSIERVSPDGHGESVAEDLPLDDMAFEKDACNDVIRFVMGHGSGSRANFEAIEPIHIKVRQNSVGPKTLQIDAENGTTALTFHSGKLRELLSGLSETEGQRSEPAMQAR